jgi:hypothetical protein
MQLKELVNNSNVIKAYITPDNKFLKVQNKNHAVYTIWEKNGGFQMTSPIKPNLKTGSATVVLGSEYDYGDLKTVISILERGNQCFPNFFSLEDREATHFLTIEQAVKLHNNILGFEKIK